MLIFKERGFMKPIQEERIRGYFIDAAKDLIRGEGLAVVSARNVAERAGYSYATLYNYFKDIRDLIFSCLEDFMEECREFVVEHSKTPSRGKESLKAVTKNYITFFVQYPGIFQLLYQQKQSDISSKSANVGGIHAFFDSLTESDWKVIKDESNGSDDALKSLRELHKLAIHGLLLMYLNRRMEKTFKQIIDESAEMTAVALNTLEQR
jgi:AcrR family transcriptional regulator